MNRTSQCYIWHISNAIRVFLLASTVKFGVIISDISLSVFSEMFIIQNATLYVQGI